MNIVRSENPPFLNDYLTHLQVVKFLANGTIEGYYQNIRQFLRFWVLHHDNPDILITADMLEGMPILEVTVQDLQSMTLRDIYEYFSFSREQCGNHDKALTRKAASLRSFFHYLTKQAQILKEDPTSNLELRSPRPALPKYLNLDESLSLLKQLTQQSKSRSQLRDYCILTLFLNCGIRLSELVGLNLSSLELDERRMRVLGKGKKERIVYLNPACMSALREYLTERQCVKTEDPALFLSNQKKRISRRRVQQVVEDAIQMAGLGGRGLSTHKLRHTAATLMYQHGHVDLLTLKSILGHESIATTEIYTHLADTAVQEAMDQSPLASVRRKKEE